MFSRSAAWLSGQAGFWRFLLLDVYNEEETGRLMQAPDSFGKELVNLRHLLPRMAAFGEVPAVCRSLMLPLRF
jgi:hypothetical protein